MKGEFVPRILADYVVFNIISSCNQIKRAGVKYKANYPYTNIFFT